MVFVFSGMYVQSIWQMLEKEFAVKWFIHCMESTEYGTHICIPGLPFIFPHRIVNEETNEKTKQQQQQ